MGTSSSDIVHLRKYGAETMRWLRQHSLGVGIGFAFIVAAISWVLLSISMQSAAPVISGIFGVAVGGLVSMATEFARTHFERRERLSALVQLLWGDLGMALLRIDWDPKSVVKDIDVSLWRDVRVGLVEAGMPGRILANLSFVYSAAEQWNRNLALVSVTKDQEAHSKAEKDLEETRRDLLKAIPILVEALKPWIPEELRDIVYNTPPKGSPPNHKDPHA